MRKTNEEIVKRFEESVEKDGYSFFKNVEMKISYKGYETRIRFDEEAKLYWGRLDNDDVSIVFSDKKLENVALKFIKEIKKR